MKNFERTLVLLGALMAGGLASADAATAQSACGGFYTIQDGDSLADIAATCGITIPALLARNPEVRDDQDLTAGARIAIPDPGAPQPSPVDACGGFYEVRPGDSLRQISVKCGLPISVLLAANPSLPQPLQLFAGARLRIPNLPRTVLDEGALTVAGALSRGDASIDTLAAVVSADSAALAAPAVELVRHTGQLERTSSACPRLRTEDGAIGLVGEISRMFASGDRVAIMGEAAESDACGDIPVLRIRIMWKPRR